MASISIIINSFKHIRRSQNKREKKAKKAHIDMRSAIGQRLYEDFIPSHEFVREETAGTLIVDLPGYRKEQIKAQIDKYGKLKISGQRLVEGNRWSRFRKEFQVPENCNMSDIRAKFENGRLNVLLPKLITEEVKGKEKPAEAPQKPEESQKPTTEPKPSTRQDDMKPNGVAKKREDEKIRGEPADARKDLQKVGEREREKEKDQTEEKKYDEKVTGAAKHEEGEKGDAVPDVQKKEAVLESAATGNGRNGESKLKHKLDELGLDFDKQKQIMLNGIVAAVLLFGLGWYLTHKLSPMEEGGH